MSQDAYLAGFFDGEGCITLGSNGGLTVSIVNTCKPILNSYEAVYRGSVANRKEIVNKPQYQWRAYGSDAKTFLESMLPYLVEKREQAEVALEYLSIKHKLEPLRFEGVKGAFANPDREPAIKQYQTILTHLKQGKHIDQ